MKILKVVFGICFFVPFLFANILFAKDDTLQKLRVAANNRYLEYSDGTPFFYLGDTAWELFHRLNREEADLYLANRAEKGFTVVQAVVLAEANGLTAPNAYGDLALINKNPTTPNDAYFIHVDYIVNKAQELGIYIGMLPTWGAHWDLFTPETARFFGQFLGKRYKDKPIIWILGGDRTIITETEHLMINAMAKGLEEGDGDVNLKTFHPRGPGLSSSHLHKEEWLDFNMYQSSHGGHDHDNGLYAEHDLALVPLKPTLDGEPRYECMPVGFYFKNWNRYDRFDDFDSRQAAYWSVLAGACGHTYGNNNVWQMWGPEHQSKIWANIPWNKAIDHPGALQMGYLRRLFESRPYQKLLPNQDVILNGPKTGDKKIRAMLARDSSFAFIYTPYGEKFTVDKNIIKAKRVKEIWWDTRYGVAYHIHSTDNWGYQTYTPPTNGRGNDWLLILESEEAGFPLP